MYFFRNCIVLHVILLFNCKPMTAVVETSRYI